MRENCRKTCGRCGSSYDSKRYKDLKDEIEKLPAPPMEEQDNEMLRDEANEILNDLATNDNLDENEDLRELIENGDGK